MPVKIPIIGEIAVKNKIRTKVLSANITSNGNISEFEYDNLTIGKKYKIRGQISFIIPSSSGVENVVVTAIHDGFSVGRVIASSQFDSGSATPVLPILGEFTATTNILTFSVTSLEATSSITGNGTRESSFITLEECQDIEESTTL